MKLFKKSSAKKCPKVSAESDCHSKRCWFEKSIKLLYARILADVGAVMDVISVLPLPAEPSVERTKLLRSASHLLPSHVCGLLTLGNSSAEANYQDMSLLPEQKPVDEWQREDVCKWLAYLGMSKYEEAFRAITGKVIAPARFAGTSSTSTKQPG